jgi:Tfp pilus assembly protein PilO
MATSGAMADFARLPPQRKAMIFVVVGALIGLLYWQFVYKSLGTKLDEARAAKAAKVAKNAQLDKDLADYKTKLERFPDLVAKAAANQKALPTDADRPALWDMLGPKIAQSGVQFVSSEDRAEAPIESFIKVPVEVTINGTFMQIKRFFASLTQANITPQSARGNDKPSKEDEDRERIISIDALKIDQPVMRDREVYLTCKFTATTFRQVEKVAPAKPGQPAQAAPAAGATTPPPPPTDTRPSAATPAGAKQRTEEAIQKGDTRNRNAQGIDEAKTPDSSKTGSGSGSARLKGGL